MKIIPQFDFFFSVLRQENSSWPLTSSSNNTGHTPLGGRAFDRIPILSDQDFSGHATASTVGFILTV